MLWIAILGQNLIFALIGHLAYFIMDDLADRFPTGIRLTLISKNANQYDDPQYSQYTNQFIGGKR